MHVRLGKHKFPGSNMLHQFVLGYLSLPQSRNPAAPVPQQQWSSLLVTESSLDVLRHPNCARLSVFTVYHLIGVYDLHPDVVRAFGSRIPKHEAVLDRTLTRRRYNSVPSAAQRRTVTARGQQQR